MDEDTLKRVLQEAIASDPSDRRDGYLMKEIAELLGVHTGSPLATAAVQKALDEGWAEVVEVTRHSALGYKNTRRGVKFIIPDADKKALKKKGNK